MTDTKALLRVQGLTVSRPVPDSSEPMDILTGVDFELAAGQSLALMGPSGCGKSLTARALLGLLPREFTWGGEISWCGQSLVDPDGERWAAVRGRGVGLVPQEPATSLNPVRSVGAQIAETIRIHQGLTADSAWRQAVQMLRETQVPHPEVTARLFAHQLSGGMRQRVLLAAALSCQPKLLIADEPTTALDMSVQKDILALIHRLAQSRQMAILYITHDVHVAALMADQVAMMSAGTIQKIVPSRELVASSPPQVRLARDSVPEPCLVAQNIEVVYDPGRLPVVSNVDLTLIPGRAVGLLGESGCGKTSLAKALSGHLVDFGGELHLQNELVSLPMTSTQRRQVQLLFQDPGSSLDPRQTVASALTEADNGRGRSPRELLLEVGLEPGLGDRFPHQLSGGQRQRVALARCLAADPAVLIADEPTSALDDAARDVVLTLLAKVMAERELAVLLISHNAEVVTTFCDQVMVMKAGHIVEVQLGGDRFQPRHPHTLDLLRAAPRLLGGDRQLWLAEQDEVKSTSFLTNTGCPHFGSCPLQKAYCSKELPQLRRLADGVYLRCPEAEVDGLSHFIDT